MGSQLIRTRSGVTLLEVLVVMLLIGIFAVIVATRTKGSDPRLIAQAEVLKAHIRYAQMRSINTDTQWGIHCQGSTYWLFQNPDTTTHRYLPGQIPGEAPYQTANEVQLSTLGIGISPATFDLIFDSWGQPNPLSPSGWTFVNKTLTLTLNATGQPPQNINITEFTGFIQ